MNIRFCNENEKIEYEIEDNPCYIIKLSDEWMNLTNTLRFKLSLEKVIKELTLNEKITIITQEQISKYYDSYRLFSSKEGTRSLLNRIFDKPSYLLVSLSFLFSTVCLIGKIFLYGYYFSSGVENFTGLLSLIINPIPIDIFSSGLMGIYILINIIVLFSSISYSMKKNIAISKRMFIIVITIIVLTILNVALFTSLEGRTIQTMSFSVLLFALMPFSLFLIINTISSVVERPGMFFISLLSVIAFLVLIIYMYIDNIVFAEIVLTYGFIFLFPLSYLVFLLLNLLVPKNIMKNDIGIKHNKIDLDKESYEDWFTSLQLLIVIIINLLILSIFGFLLVVFSLGSAYSEIPFNSQYSVIKYFEPNTKEETTILGTIVGEKNNTYYISTYKDKRIVTVKDTEIYSQSCNHLASSKSVEDFKRDVDKIKIDLIEKYNLDCSIEFIDNSEDEIMSYHKIVSSSGNYEVNVYYDDLYTKEIGKILINIIKNNEETSLDSDLYHIKNYYFNYFKLDHLSESKKKVYYLNGIFNYEKFYNDKNIIEKYYFKSNEV